MSRDINSYFPSNGRYIKEDGSIFNLADKLGGTSVGLNMDINFFSPRSGRMVKEDGSVVNVADILSQMTFGSSETTVKYKQNTDTTVTLPEETPYDLYIFPEMETLSVTIADENTEVHFFFDSGATATTFSLQSQGGGQIYTDAYSIDSNMRYEVSVLHSVAYIKGVSMGEA